MPRGAGRLGGDGVGVSQATAVREGFGQRLCAGGGAVRDHDTRDKMCWSGERAGCSTPCWAPGWP